MSASGWSTSIALSYDLHMSRATRLIRKLDKALALHKSFGDDPEAFVDEILEALDQDVATIQSKDKPIHWAEIYVERDRALIKQQVLNRIMQKSSE